MLYDSTMRRILKLRANIFPEAQYEVQAQRMEVIGNDFINQNPVICLEIDFDGWLLEECYHALTGLKYQSKQKTGENNELYQRFTNYQLIDGILFPHTTEIRGLTAWPLIFELQELKVNPEIDPNLFEISRDRG